MNMHISVTGYGKHGESYFMGDYLVDSSELGELLFRLKRDSKNEIVRFVVDCAVK